MKKAWAMLWPVTIVMGLLEMFRTVSLRVWPGFHSCG